MESKVRKLCSIQGFLLGVTGLICLISNDLHQSLDYGAVTTREIILYQTDTFLFFIFAVGHLHLRQFNFTLTKVKCHGFNFL